MTDSSNRPSMTSKPAQPPQGRPAGAPRQAGPQPPTGQQARAAQPPRKQAPQAKGRPIDPQAGRAHGRRRAIIIACACAAAALLVWALVWLFACNGDSLFDPNARTGQAPYKSAEEMQAELDRTVEEGMFNISIASIIEFDDGAAPGTAYIENVPGNPYNMQVTITEDATGDVLYESGILAPNQFIEQIVLSKELPAGSYDATATFTAIDQTTYEEVGQAAAKVTINVLG